SPEFEVFIFEVSIFNSERAAFFPVLHRAFHAADGLQGARSPAPFALRSRAITFQCAPTWSSARWLHAAAQSLVAPARRSSNPAARFSCKRRGSPERPIRRGSSFRLQSKRCHHHRPLVGKGGLPCEPQAKLLRARVLA